MHAFAVAPLQVVPNIVFVPVVLAPPEALGSVPRIYPGQFKQFTLRPCCGLTMMAIYRPSSLDPALICLS